MTLFRAPGEYLNDSYNLRLSKLRKYSTRTKLIIAAAAGLLFFADTELIIYWEKIVLVIWVFLTVFFAATAFLGFEDSISEVECKLKNDERFGLMKIVGVDWLTKDERRYFYSVLSTVLLALSLLACMLIKYCSYFSQEKKDHSLKTEQKYITKSTTFSIGPFVQGFDTLYADSMKYKLTQLKDSLTSPVRNFTELNIYGGVDKRPLKGLSKNIFGDNITLAQSRGEWIKKQIISFNCLSNTCQFLTSVVGAKRHSSKYSDEDHAINRYVIINCKYQDSVEVAL